MNLTAPLWLWSLQTLSCTEGLVSSCLFHLLIMNKCHFTYWTKWFFMIFHGRMEVFSMEPCERVSNCFIRYSQSMSSQMESNFLLLTVIFWHLPCCLIASSWACKARSQKTWIWYKHSYSPQTLSLQPSIASNWTSLSDNTGESVLLPLC